MIRDGNLGVSLNPISLGGTYASDAAANAGYVARAAASGQSQTVPAGCVYYNATTNRPRFYNGTSWDEFVPGGPAGVGTLDDAENNGRTITLASGAIVLNDSTAGAGQMLQFNKSGAGSGNVIDINVSAALTGNIFDLATSAAWNANVFNIDLTSSNAASRVLNVPNDGLAHSGTGWVAQIANAGTGAGNWVDIRVNGAGSGNIINVVSSAAHTGDFLHFDQTAATGARLINLDLAANTVTVIRVAASTGSGDILGFSASGAYTGNVLAPDLTNAVGGRALNVTAAGARTASWFNISDSSTSSVPGILYTLTGVVTESLMTFDINANANVPITRYLLASQTTGSGAILIDEEGAAKAGYDIRLAKSGTGTARGLDIPISGAGSGDAINITTSAAYTGNFLRLDNTTATGAVFIRCDVAAAAHSVPIFDLNSASTGADIMFDIDYTGVSTGNCFDVAYAAASTGNTIAINLTNAVACRAGLITAAGARTTNVLAINDSSTSNAPGILYTLTGVVTDSLLTFDINANANVPIQRFLLASQTTGSGAILIDEEAAARGGYCIQFTKNSTGTSQCLDINVSGAGSGNVIDVDVTAAATGNILDITTSAAYTGQAVSVVLTTSAATASAYNFDGGAARAWSTTQHYLQSGSGAFTSNLSSWVVNGAGTSTSNLLAVSATAAFAGDIFDLDMTAMAAGARCLVLDTGSRAFSASPILITASGAVTPTADLLRINCAWTGGTANLIGVAFTGSWGAGDVLNINMAGTAAGAQALVIPSSVVFSNPLIDIDGTAAHTASLLDIASNGGAGAANVAALMNLNYSSAAGLVNTADCVRIASVMSHAADSHVLAVEQSTGAGTAGAHCLYISATGANVEGIRVDDGVVTIDERIVVGDTTNGVRIVGDGGTAGVEYLGARRPTKSLWIDAQEFQVGASAGSTTTTGLNQLSWDLDGAGATESIRTRVALPYDYATATAVNVRIYWTSTGGGGNVVFRVDFLSRADTETLAGALTVGTKTAGLASGAASALVIHTEVSDANLAIAGATLDKGELLVFEIVRLSADAADTLAADARILGVRLMYTADAA